MLNQDIGFIISSTSEYKNIKNLFDEFVAYGCDHQYLCFTYNKEITNNILGIPLLPLSQSKFFDGSLFVFNLQILDIIKNFPTIHNIYYYLTCVEWEQYNHINYFDLKNIYGENKIKVITQNKNLYNIYYRCWEKHPYGIMETLSYENFKDVIFSANRE